MSTSEDLEFIADGINASTGAPIAGPTTLDEFVALAERLVGRGYDLRIYDPNVSVSLLRGANRRWVDERLPHLTSLLTETAREAVEHGTVVVVGVGGAETEAALAHAGGRDIVDLVRITGGQSLPATASYRGLAW